MSCQEFIVQKSIITKSVSKSIIHVPKDRLISPVGSIVIV